MKELKRSSVKAKPDLLVTAAVLPHGKVLPFPDCAVGNCPHAAGEAELDHERVAAGMKSRGPYAAFSFLPIALQRWRVQRGLKISAAASALGVAASTWGHWETGFRFPTGSLLLDLVRYTGLSLVELVCAHAENCPLHRLAKAKSLGVESRGEGISQPRSPKAGNRQSG